MALAITTLTSGSVSNSSTVTTASITPSANKLIICIVSNFCGSTPTPATPTVTGNGLTWVQIRTRAMAADARITIFRAMGTPTTGAVSIQDFSGGGAGNYTVDYHIFEINRVKITGSNGADAVVQSADSHETDATSPTTVTLGAFSNINNATIGAIMTNGGLSVTVGSGFTELIATTSLETEYKLSNDTSVDWTHNNGFVTLAVAIEIAAGPTSGLLTSDI